MSNGPIPEAPAEVTEDDHHAESEDALISPETSRGRHHSQIVNTYKMQSTTYGS